MTGSSHGEETSYDYATLKYDSAGNQLWLARYDGPEQDRDYATAMVVDAAGNVYVTGRSIGTGTGYDFATLKYSQQ